jgi:hypothetical protein
MTTNNAINAHGTLLLAANNLSDLVSAATSRLNLGVNLCFYQITQQTLTSTATYTPTPGMVYCISEVLGSGGGGGGAVSGSTGSYGGGGGAGGYGVDIFTAATVGASQSVIIGAAGTGGTGYAPGTSGGTCSFGTLISCTGGAGGGYTTNSSVNLAIGGLGGAGTTTAGINGVGQSGGVGINLGIGVGCGGAGGSTIYGAGGIALVSQGNNGASGTGYGGGGGGACVWNQGDSNTGGAGAKGVVRVTEFIQRS